MVISTPQRRSPPSASDVVRAYLKNLVVSLKTGMNVFVKGLVTEELARRLQIWLDAWRFSGYTMDAELLDLRIRSVKEKNGTAVVVTEELWVYSYYYVKTGKVALPERRIFYVMRYRLRREDRGWRIEEIEILREESHGRGGDLKS